jgi:hypothetical protein
MQRETKKVELLLQECFERTCSALFIEDGSFQSQFDHKETHQLNCADGLST